MRPRKCRKIGFIPRATVFKPQGIPVRELAQVELALEEMEALRLADGQQLYHEEAGRIMGVSRQTFSRILQSARHKVAEALTGGKALVIRHGDDPSDDQGSR